MFTEFVVHVFVAAVCLVVSLLVVMMYKRACMLSVVICLCRGSVRSTYSGSSRSTCSRSSRSDQLPLVVMFM